ncbi:MAG: hypothetical protein JW834_01350 [Candidatus Diapherotrites archaeon]|nr:hypothetical protein [Candidatus Diapherotrites archaeon]
MIELTMILAFATAFAVTYIVTPQLIYACKVHGFMGKDMHKTKETKVAELGGFAIILGFCMGVFAAIGAAAIVLNTPIELVKLLAVTSSVLIVLIVGALDDLFQIRWRTKMLMPIIAAVPLMALTAGDTSMVLPFIGGIDLSLAYLFIVIPLGITGAANAVNMIAGYNGVETGMSGVIIASLAIIALMAGQAAAAIVLLAMLGALLAFFRFNYYPARIFPGDTGTLQMGALIAAAAVIGNMEKYALLMFALYFVNAAIFAWGMKKRAKLVKFARVDKKGVLQAPESFWKHYLPYLIIHYTKPTEKQLVHYFIGAQAIACAAVLAAYALGY